MKFDTPKHTAFSIQRAIIYLSAAIFPPLIIGSLIAFASLSSTLLHKTSGETPIAAETTAPPPLTSKLKAALLVSNEGTQITDLLSTYQILAESGVFDVFTVAPQRKLSPTTGAIDLLPHYSFKNMPKADLLVIPPVLDPMNPEIIRWIQTNAPSTKLILSLCEGARVATQAHLFQGLPATSHFLALSDLRNSEPSAHWISGVRYVDAGKLVSSAGITASLDAALYAVEKLAGKPIAQETAQKLAYAWNREKNPTLSEQPSHDTQLQAVQSSEFFQIFFRAGFHWFKDRIGVLLYPGVSEMGLAAALDTLPRSPDFHVFSTSSTRKVYRTANGLDLVPTENAEELLPAQYLIIPSGHSSTDPKSDPSVARWIHEHEIQVKDLRTTAPGLSYDQTFDWLFEHESSGITGFVAKMMEYPHLNARNTSTPPSSAFIQNWPITLWIKPILIAGLGVFLAFWIEKRLRKVHSNF